MRKKTSVFDSSLVSYERVAAEVVKSQKKTPVLMLEPHFVQKGAISSRLIGTACGLKREKKKKERDRDRGQKREREKEKI
jgi:hypothetical protein